MNLIVQVFTVVAIGAAGLSSASAAPVSAEEPPKLVKTGAGTFVPDFPGTPLPVYELEFANPEDWPGEELLRNHLPALNAPESLEILSINPERRKVLLRTTRFAARSGFSSIGGTLRLIEDAGPEIQCARIYANLNLEETPREGDPTGIKWARSDGDCAANRRVSWARTVIVEGVAQNGSSLYYVVAKDPRWFLNETFTEDGRPIPLGEGKRDWSDVGLTIFAPVPEHLQLFRVWEMNREGDLSAIGEIPFVVPEWRE